MRLRPVFICALVALLALAQASVAPAVSTPADRPPVNRQLLVMIHMAPEHFRPNGAYAGTYGDQLGQSARQRVAGEIAGKYHLRILDNWPMPLIGVDCFVMTVREGQSTTSAAAAMSHDERVSWAEPVAVYTARSSPARHNDPLYPAEPAATEWHLADLHRMSTGRGARIAIIDSGIDAQHPDLSGQLLVNRNFVSGEPFIAEQHGTAVAGVSAAKADNGLGIAGVAPGSRLLGLRACWQAPGPAPTVCDTLSLAKALYFAVENHADIINLSLSGPRDRLLRDVISLALARRSAVVAAFDMRLEDGGFPASLPGVIAVADASLAGSRTGVYIAPGHDVPTTEPGGRWFLVNGSSFAAAHVSGLLALLKERRGSAPVVLVSERRGGGRIDACSTLMRVVRTCDCECPTGGFAIVGNHR